MSPQTSTDKPATDLIWAWLHDVPDPEIPVISVVDLGIIRKVEWEQDTLVVSVTPTYSGCPATAVINADIEAKLRKEGIDNIRLERQLSPAWTTAWISERGREKLLDYGIAPPVEGTSASEVNGSSGCALNAGLNGGTGGGMGGGQSISLNSNLSSGIGSNLGSGLLARPSITVSCPRCQSTDTENVSQFGSTPCKAAYRCKACLEPFDYFKCI